MLSDSVSAWILSIKRYRGGDLALLILDQSMRTHCLQHGHIVGLGIIEALHALMDDVLEYVTRD